MLKYFHFLYKKMKQYDKCAKNPFYYKKINTTPTQTTYIWLEKPK